MTAPDTLALLQAQFPTAVLSTNREAIDPFAVIEPMELVKVSLFLRDDPRMLFEMLNDITAVDYLEPDPKKAPKAGFEPHLELVYHISSFVIPSRRFTMKVLLPRWKDNQPGELPEVPSVSSVWRGANWHEREAYDLMGIRFLNHPDLRRILLSDDWVGYPLRKDYEYPLEYHDIRCR